MSLHALGTFSSGAPTYIITIAPTEFPVTLCELKNWLRVTNTASDALLNSIIKGVTRRAELYTKRTFIATTYKTNRDNFGDFTDDGIGSSGLSFFGLFNNDNPFLLRRTPVSSITSIKYFNTSNVQTTIPATDYYFTVTDGSEYSQVLPEIDKFWPSDLQRQKLQEIEIIFTAGWANQDEFLEQYPDLHEALLAHMADVYVNRGDCSESSIGGTCGCSSAPPEALNVYDQYRIIDFAM